jgi:hypothetical protein
MESKNVDLLEFESRMAVTGKMGQNGSQKVLVKRYINSVR